MNTIYGIIGKLILRVFMLTRHAYTVYNEGNLFCYLIYLQCIHIEAKNHTKRMHGELKSAEATVVQSTISNSVISTPTPYAKL